MALNMRTGKLADIASLDHVNILTADVEACRKFYVDALGFEEGFRPAFDVPGLWLYLEGAPVVHIIQVDEAPPKNSGSIDHIAFRAHNFDKFTARLDANGIAYEDREIPGMDLHQLFCYDPHGIKVEFNFEGQDRPWTTVEKEHKAMKTAAKSAKATKSGKKSAARKRRAA
jgi:catechol 2,3-dioxygenase-like lactoylglutathione lyase family enzyme